MAKIIIENLQRRAISVHRPAPLLQSIQRQHIDWMHACGGKGRCTTCRAEVMAGMEHLSAPNEHEARLQGRMKPNERLTCQAVLSGEGQVVLRVPRNCQFPHLQYDPDAAAEAE
jgi:2Fe-2S ferredoxin